ncbi:MAG: cupin domain-containing protein [Novosphingobium sp.]
MQFRDFDSAAFLRDTWQQRALLIRDPWRAWQNPLDGDELAGLACEPDVESRLVVRAGGTWRAEDGPFAAGRFGKIGKEPWTLLVQAVDHHVPEVAALIAPFRFVPNWRIDDVMVSYAGDGGGVGPHFDRYDVFLVQGQGRRRWQIGPRCDERSEFLPHDDLRLLAEFTATEEWVLEPGDILYVPPGVAHNGVALGDDCMTYSIGFRAPSRSELIGHWADAVLADLTEDDRYADSGLPPQGNPGEISAEALARLHALVIERMGDRQAFARWFGIYNSARKYPDVDWRLEEPVDTAMVREWIAEGVPVERNPASRFSFIRGDALLLFVDGECFDCTGEAARFAERLCAEERIVVVPELAGSDAAVELVVQLMNQGSIAFAEEA